jgi:predicted aspartyl protease
VSVLEHEVTLIGTRGSARCRALFDSGATYSIIRRDIAERIELLVPLPDPENWIFETARVGDHIQALYRVMLNFRFDDSKARFSDEFVVFDACSEELIVGAKTMQAWHITLDFKTETVNYSKTAERLRVI